MASLAYLLSKVGTITPATRSKAIEIIGAAEKAGHEVRFVWGMGGGTEHGSGRALDLMVSNEAAGDFIRDYIWANRARLRLRHVIWEQHITSTVVQPGVRRLMADRGNATKNHYDHNHVWFNPGDYVAPPVTGAAKPKPRPKPVAKPTVKVRTLYWNRKRTLVGNDVERLQKELKRLFPAYAGRLKVDKHFGPATDWVVREFQRRARLKDDGRVGPTTRARLRRYGARL